MAGGQKGAENETLLANRFFDLVFARFLGLSRFVFEGWRRENQPRRLAGFRAVHKNRASIRIEEKLSLTPNHQ